MSLRPIHSIETLHAYLHAAIQLEHATIPVYLTTFYTLHPGTNLDAAQVLRAVVVEEMLHMTLAANILNAVGGRVDLTQRGFVPAFPTYLPDGERDFEVSRARFSRDTIDMFLKIERPAKPEDHSRRFVTPDARRVQILPTHRSDEGDELHFYSIGEFYHAIQLGLEHLCEELGEAKVFTGTSPRQVTPEYYYSGGGEIVPVSDVASARAAIRLISEQGEGYEGAITDYEDEVSHYYRFDQIAKGRYYRSGDVADQPTGDRVDVNWEAAYPIKTNATMADYPESSGVHGAAVEFNRTYKSFLAKLTTAFDGKPQLLIPAVGDMFVIKEKACQLIRNPIPGGDGLHAAPTFEVDLV